MLLKKFIYLGKATVLQSQLDSFMNMAKNILISHKPSDINRETFKSKIAIKVKNSLSNHNLKHILYFRVDLVDWISSLDQLILFKQEQNQQQLWCIPTNRVLGLSVQFVPPCQNISKQVYQIFIICQILVYQVPINFALS